MSKFKGKFSKKKDFEGERSAGKGRPESGKSPSKDRSVKYRKKNFRDYESNPDEDGSRRSAPTDENIPKTAAAGRAERSGRTNPPRSKGAGDARKQSPAKDKPFRDADARGKDARRSKAPTQEPPTYDILPSDRELGEKGSAEERNIRLNKYIADAGVCSRREADKLIEAGEIQVNGATVTELGYKVSRKDVVTHNGRKLRQEKLVYVLLNKPKGFITTVDDPEDRKTVMQLVQTACEERIYPVGRLDRNTTGLLLLTNDGELATKLTHPSHQVKKIYQVDLDKPIAEEDVEKIQQGLVLEDGPAKVDELAILSEDRSILGVEIHIGRNRIVRRIFEHLGYEVIRLDRVMFAGLTKKDLPRGKWRYLSQKELIRLKHFK
jgi:23S rRNA pseudouridine2605 synthase